MKKDQTPLGQKKLASEGLARKFGDWFRNLALNHQGGNQEIHDFMAHPDATNRAHQLINETAKEFQVTRPLRERKPRFSLMIGTFVSKADLIKSVEATGHQVTDWAKGFIGREEFVLLGIPERYDFFETTVKELTGKSQVLTPELYAARDRLGYCDAPDESALVLRMEYTDQPMNEWRAVLSRPRAAAGGLLNVLSVERFSHGSFVGRFYTSPDSIWYGDERLLVCRKYQ